MCRKAPQYRHLKRCRLGIYSQGTIQGNNIQGITGLPSDAGGVSGLTEPDTAVEPRPALTDGEIDRKLKGSRIDGMHPKIRTAVTSSWTVGENGGSAT